MKELTGKEFGELKVLRQTDKKSNNSVVWLCKCSCGNLIEVPASKLQSGRKISCGCIRNRKLEEKLNNTKEINGIKILGWKRNDKGKLQHEIECPFCKTHVWKSRNDLITGNTQSCGCQSRRNIKDLIGRRFGNLLVESYVGTNKYNNAVWLCKCKKCGTYIECTNSHLTGGQTTSCGCIKKEAQEKIMKKHLKEVVIEGTNLDVIKRTRLGSNNQHGHLGACYNKKTGKYKAFIRFKGKTYNLGTFDEGADATKAYLEAKKILHGEFLEEYKEKYPDIWERLYRNKENKKV